MRVTLRNNFHNSESYINVPQLPYTISRGQFNKVHRELCGVSTCTCGGVRGPQVSPDGHPLTFLPDLDHWDGTGPGPLYVVDEITDY